MSLYLGGLPLLRKEDLATRIITIREIVEERNDVMCDPWHTDEEFRIWLAETGKDREPDYDPERHDEKLYSLYLADVGRALK